MRFASSLLLVIWLLSSVQPVMCDDSSLWPALDSEIEKAIADGETSGATLLVGRGNQILYHRAYGLRDVQSKEPMSLELLFDAASLTKPLVTAVACHLLVQDGKLNLKAKVTEYLPLPWSNSPTVSQLLTHHAGLGPIVSEDHLPEALYQNSPLKAQPGMKFVYSDVGYLLLQRIIEKQSGLTLDEFFQKRIAAPLELDAARFRPSPENCVPTYGVTPGTVHDPRARKLDGVAGHAGLFIHARDVHLLLSRLTRILNRESLDSLFLYREGGRSLGLDAETQYSSARGNRFSPLTSAGHTGFTGTSFWWDGSTGLHLILMTSRLHPDNKGNVISLRRRLATLVGEHFLGAQVQTGLEVLQQERFSRLEGKRVGFVLNQTSRDRFGRHLTEFLNQQKAFELRALFTPEHGLLGVRDEKIEHGHHAELGVPIFSLYGETRKPKKEWFEGLDVLVFDLQDVGVRYYTYISTLKACLEVAKESGTKVMVLDRPNPLGGEVMDGNRAEIFSFIACDALPTVHGMTMGELGRFLNREIGAELSIVKMKGWSRSMKWEDTGLPLLSPSPNLAELEAIKLYPVLGQLEWCELSVGRGTRSPFRVLGAPYIKDPRALAEFLETNLEAPVSLQPRFFIPQSSKFDGELCGGVELTITGELVDPALLGLKMGRLLAQRFPADFEVEKMKRHLGVDKVKPLWESTWNNDDWRAARRSYLLYP